MKSHLICLIREVINSPFEDTEKEEAILQIIAADDNAIPYLLKILNYERKGRKELLNDTNLNLSRALFVLDTKRMKVQIPFVIDEIKKHYIKWQNSVKCTFNIKDLP